MIPQNNDVPVAFTVGSPLLAASYRVRGPSTGTLGDGMGTIVPWTAIDLGTQTTPNTIILTIPAALNVITTTVIEVNDVGTQTTAPAVHESRLVDLVTTIANLPGALTTLDYQIVSDQELVLMQNSFQDYASACNWAAELANIPGWIASSADQRIPALMQSFDALARLNYEIYYDKDDIYFRNRASYGLPYINTIGRLYNYSANDFLALDPDFQRKISRAQVIQADYLLGGDPIEQQRQSGIVSTTVNTAGHTFNSKKPLYLSVCKACLRELSGYIKYNVSLVRS